jgi:hypothetical protein
VANHPLRCDAPALHHLLEQGFERLHLRRRKGVIARVA